MQWMLQYQRWHVAKIDRTPAGMNISDDDLAQAAVAGSRTNQPSIIPDFAHRRKIRERVTLGDEGNHFIYEAVEACDHRP